MAPRKTTDKAPSRDLSMSPPDDLSKASPERDPSFDKFLHAFTRMPNKTEALKAARLTPEELEARKRNDSDFARSYLEADELGTDVLEDAAVSRAVCGWDEPVFDMRRGTEVGTIRKYSDTLLVFLLKGKRKKYRGEDNTGGRGVSEEARREMNAIFDEMQGAIGRQLEIAPTRTEVSAISPKSAGNLVGRRKHS
jgi:hypothetical protein